MPAVQSSRRDLQSCRRRRDCTWAAEHVVGIAKDVDPRVIEGLRMNFTGECTEVGMYLAMGRVADREGYPEVAETWKRAAYEEADHASRFAEMLGEVLTASSKANLAARVEAEIRRHRRQVRARQTGERTRLRRHPRHRSRDGPDEARHGKAFKGLLDRYFA